MTTLTMTANETARMDSHQVAGYLLARLGPTLTAYIANVRSRAMPRRWACEPGDPAGAEPALDKVQRLRAAHSVFLAIETNENDQVARNWLISANPRLDGATPAELIRDGQYPAVYRAAEAFIGDQTNA